MYVPISYQPDVTPPSTFVKLSVFLQNRHTQVVLTSKATVRLKLCDTNVWKYTIVRNITEEERTYDSPSYNLNVAMTVIVDIIIGETI